MASKINAALAPNATTGSGGEFKITFYSTSPKDESKSKYPMQTKTSYTVPDNGNGETEINFGKPIAASSHTKTRVLGFRPDERKRDDSKRGSKKHGTPDVSPGSSANEILRSRNGRITKKPQRYEPVETVTDDFDVDDYDTDDSFEN